MRMILILRTKLILLLDVLIMIRADTGFVNTGGVNIDTWFSDPFDHVCLGKCDELIVKHIGNVSVENRTCAVQCQAGQIVQRQKVHYRFNRVSVRNPRTNQLSECLIGVLHENIYCAVMSSYSGVRPIDKCRRRNDRYYLPRKKCDNIAYPEVGGKSCSQACMDSDQDDSDDELNVDIMRSRTKFTECYTGRVTESYRVGKRSIRDRFYPGRNRYWNFCRADVTPCRECFRWGEWKPMTSCSRTCGSPGTQTYRRVCGIEDSTDSGSGVRYKTVTEGYCIAYLGGSSTKEEKCGGDAPCPNWSTWGAWSECPTSVPVTPKTSHRRKNCTVPRHKRNAETENTNLSYNLTTPTELVPTSGVKGSAVNESTTNSTTKQEGPLTLKGKGISQKSRSRICMDRSHGGGCPGEAIEFTDCGNKEENTGSVESNTLDPDSSANQDDCVELPTITTTEENDRSEITKAPANRATKNTAVHSTSALPYKPTRVLREEGETTNTAVVRLFPMTSEKPIENSNRTKINLPENEVSSVLTEYAVAFIIGLLVFIFLLLVTLIAVCGCRLYLKKNNPTRYEFTTPSFSAGTVGSIPSGIVQGFTHPLGLRRGSGTFGRSGSTLNGAGLTSDALSSRGSNRSMSSAISGSTIKMKKIKQKRLLDSGMGQSINGKKDNSPQFAFPSDGEQTGRSGRAFSKSGLEDRKPSSSSLLSSASGMTSCSNHPLPPIPVDQRPRGFGMERSPFQRGTGRSSSLTPLEQDHQRNSSQLEMAEERAGRRTYTLALGGVHYSRHRERTPDDSWNHTWQSRQKFSNKSSGKGSNDGYCRHECEESTCGGTPNRYRGNLSKKHRNLEAASSENEYWSVTRGDAVDSSNDSSDASKSVHPIPRERKFSRNKVLKPSSTERVTEGIQKSIMKQKLPLKETEIGRQKETGDKDDNNEVKMVDNVLYAVSNDTVQQHSAHIDERSQVEGSPSQEMSSSGDGSVRSHLGSCGEGSERPQHQRLKHSRDRQSYNRLDLEDSSKGSDLDASPSEDDYDHLTDQFSVSLGQRPKTKYPGTMTSLRQLRHQNEFRLRGPEEDNIHDYESIEFEEDSNPHSAEIFRGTASYTKVKPSDVRAAKDAEQMKELDLCPLSRNPEAPATIGSAFCSSV